MRPTINPFGRIGFRLLRWFLVIALIPLLFMGYQGYYFARQAVQREVFLHMEAVAQAKRHAIEQWFAERMADIRMLAVNPQLVAHAAMLIRHPDSQALKNIAEVLEAWHLPSDETGFLCLYDATGQPLLCTSHHEQLIPSFDRSILYRDAAKATGPVTGPIYLNPSIGASMHLAQTIRDAAGNPLVMLVMTLPLTQTLNPIILETTGLGRTGQAYLVDTDKVMLTPSRFMDHPDPLTHTMDTDGIRRALAGGSGAGVYPGFEGQEVIGAWTFMPEQRWALIAEMDADEAFAPLAVLRRNTIIVALLTLAMVTLVVGFISRSISAPIRTLAEASLDVSQGNLDRTVTVRLGDELGELAERFNAMVRSLKESQHSLQDAYDQLLRAQKQLVQSERLAAIGELAASVVHEVRNPLSAVKMNLRILETKCAVDAVAAEHFRLAKAQTERLETMLTDLLDYAKPLPLRREAVAVPDLIRDALQAFEGERQAGNLTVTVELEPALPPLTVDRSRIVQLLHNLLLNAMQAAEPGAELRISAMNATADKMPAVNIAVADRGRGIAPEHLKRIFEPFFTTRKHGTGLGLPNARKIAEAHGGALRVESVLQQGTTVHIVLPGGKETWKASS